MSIAERDTSLDAVKGFTILIVMLGHVLVLNRINDPYLYDFIKAVQMPLFMIVSGYLCGKARKVSDVPSYGRMLWKRVLGYILPFLAWTLIFHLDDFTWAIPAYFEQPERGMWFLITLFVLTFMVYTAQLGQSLANKVTASTDAGNEGIGSDKEKGKSALHGWIVFFIIYGILALAVVAQNAAGIPWLGPHLTKIYMPYYMAAYLYGCFEARIREIITGNARAAVSILGGAYCLAIVITKDMMVMNGFADYVLQTLASFGGCICVIWLLYHLKTCKVKGFLSWLGMYTLEIYAIHYHLATVLNPGELTFAVYSPRWFLFILESFAVMSAGTAIVAFILHRTKWTTFIFYGKGNPWKKAGK